MTVELTGIAMLMPNRLALVATLLMATWTTAAAPKASAAGVPSEVRLQLYGYIVVEYRPRTGRTVYYVSQVIGYCVSVQRDPMRGLKQSAREEVARYEGQGWFPDKPAGATREVDFFGGDSSLDRAERSRDYYIKRGAKTFASTLDTVYYPVKDCRQ